MIGSQKWFLNKYDLEIESLPCDEGKRCPALDSFGSQCQLHQGHKGKHGVARYLTYFEHARGIFERGGSS